MAIIWGKNCSRHDFPIIWDAWLDDQLNIHVSEEIPLIFLVRRIKMQARFVTARLADWTRS